MGQTATAYPVPLGLPFEGMDLQTPLSSLPVSRAPFIENFFLDGQTLKVRDGIKFHSLVAATSFGSGDICSEISNYISASGTETLFGICQVGIGNQIYNLTANPAVAVGAAVTLSAPNAVNFKNYQYWMDGSNTPVQYDGTNWTTMAAAATPFTGPTLTTLVCGAGYRNRLYLVQKNTTKVWYGGVDSIGGAMTSFDIGSLLEEGGYLHNVCTVNYGQSNSASSFLCFVSSQGEVLVYTGSYPGSPTFESVAKFKIGKPYGRKAYLKYQGDTLIATSLGLVSLRDMIAYSSSQTLEQYKTYSNSIDPFWKKITAANQNTEISLSFYSVTGCIYVSFVNGLVRSNNKVSSDPTGEGFLLVMNVLSKSWTMYTFAPFFVTYRMVEHSGKLIAALGTLGGAIRLETTGQRYDEDIEDVSSPASLPITANILSACISSERDSGKRQKFNALNLFAYINAGSATDPVQCYLVENFGKVTGTTKPTVIEDDFNSIPLNVGSSREYVQYSLTVKTNSSTGDPTILYNINALMEQGGYR